MTSAQGEAKYVPFLRATVAGTKPAYERGDFIVFRVGPTFPSQLALVVGAATGAESGYRCLVFLTGRRRFRAQTIRRNCVCGLSAETDVLAMARVAARTSKRVREALQ